MPTSPDEPVPAARLRPFGLGTALFVVVSSMVGTGVLTTSGYLILDLRHGGLVLGLWALGGVVAVCGALALAEVMASLPRSGGEYTILAAAYGPLPAFLAGWVSLLLGFAGPIAAAANASATYLLTLFGLAQPLAVRILASMLILGVAAAHCIGPRATAWLQGWVTLTKLFLLSLLALAGLLASASRTTPAEPFPPFQTSLALTLLTSLVYVSYAFTGWNGAAYLGGEIRDPQRDLPRAILGGTLLVTLLYLGLNLMFVRAVSVEQLVELARRDGRDAVEPIAEIAARSLFGPTWSRSLSAVVGLVLLGSLSAMLLTGPRVAVAMAERGHFLALARHDLERGGAPVGATGFLAATALGLLWSGSFESLVVFSGVGLGLFSLPTVAAVYVLRRRRPDLPRPFRVPGYPIVPAIYLLVTTALLVAAFVERLQPSLLAVAAIVAGIVPGLVLTRRGSGQAGDDAA